MGLLSREQEEFRGGWRMKEAVPGSVNSGANQKWVLAEDAQLKLEHERGVSFERMVILHQRTAKAIQCRLALLQPWLREGAEVPEPCPVGRRGARWSQTEERHLKREHDEGVALSTMASAHGRTEGAIIARLCLLEPWATPEQDSSDEEEIVTSAFSRLSVDKENCQPPGKKASAPLPLREGERHSARALLDRAGVDPLTTRPLMRPLWREWN